ncbi:PP2C family protein-serine/threonine phosphatase [Streptomyces lichenis]|uniref:SpoIIE family protein phosphatase n=1 Tax=Streptomyces lichenis TaxID=2306967 RepID=A0ABT0IE81_9ACTN|nr:GAF domain-containing SpoIIE family protein phosphatase [Streptomyces lichenis]MCK8679592.1 SpoIIE family protein phosphatase [Streptomyces lichenis]
MLGTPEAAPSRTAGERRRLDAVHRYGLLDDAPDGALDRVAALAARLFGAPMATVSVVGADRIRLKAAYGPTGARELGREPGLAASAIERDGPYVVPDTLRDPRTAAHPLVQGAPGVRFYAAAPITTPGGDRLGTVDVWDTRPREADADRLAALGELAALVAEELEGRLAAARTLAAERRMRTGAERLARTLQRTLLPPALPAVPGLSTAAAYHTASPDEVGGDFYDLFPLADGRWAFFLGDVCGKGADAAALTSLTRYTLRAAAIHDPDPGAALATLDAVLKAEYQDGDPRYCTAVFGVLESAPDGSFEVVLAAGGHPPALVLRADGTSRPVPTPGGQLIGLLPAPHFARNTVRLDPGDALLLYTDGLTEARTDDGGMLGEDGLADRLADLAPHGAEALLAAVDKLLGDLGDGVSDDTALLALSVPARPAGVPPTAPVHPALADPPRPTAPSAQENR